MVWTRSAYPSLKWLTKTADKNWKEGKNMNILISNSVVTNIYSRREALSSVVSFLELRAAAVAIFRPGFWHYYFFVVDACFKGKL